MKRCWRAGAHLGVSVIAFGCTAKETAGAACWRSRKTARPERPTRTNGTTTSIIMRANSVRHLRLGSPARLARLITRRCLRTPTKCRSSCPPLARYVLSSKRNRRPRPTTPEIAGRSPVPQLAAGRLSRCSSRWRPAQPVLCFDPKLPMLQVAEALAQEGIRGGRHEKSSMPERSRRILRSAPRQPA